MKAKLMSRALMALSLCVGSIVHAQDPLPSWNDTSTKKAIIDFVARVTKEGSPDFVKLEERIATFDNDGTLWAEKPIYFQFQFATDRVKALAPQHPQWKKQKPFTYILAGDRKALLADGKSMMALMAVSHSGMTTDDFNKIVKQWLHTAKHPSTGRLYTQMVYQPMLELLSYLRANGFKTFIVSGGGVEFMRCFAEQTYGIPPEHQLNQSDCEARQGTVAASRCFYDFCLAIALPATFAIAHAASHHDVFTPTLWTVTFSRSRCVVESR